MSTHNTSSQVIWGYNIRYQTIYAEPPEQGTLVNNADPARMLQNSTYTFRI